MFRIGVELDSFDSLTINSGFIGNEVSQGYSKVSIAILDGMTGIESSTKQTYLDFIQANFGKISERKMAKLLGIGKTTVNRWRQEFGLKIFKNTVNENYFETWSAEMAYILGFIAADGNVSWNEKKGYYSLTITAAEKDEAHLKKIREKLQSTKPLLYANSTKSNRLIVNSKKICRDLIALGIVPAKSKIIQFQPVPDEFLSHFIRGVVDGDGSVSYFNRKISPYFNIQIASGSKVFLEELARRVGKIGINANVRDTKRGVFILQYTCKRAINFANFIYSDADFYLERKFAKFQIALKSKKEE